MLCQNKDMSIFTSTTYWYQNKKFNWFKYCTNNLSPKKPKISYRDWMKWNEMSVYFLLSKTNYFFKWEKVTRLYTQGLHVALVMNCTVLKRLYSVCNEQHPRAGRNTPSQTRMVNQQYREILNCQMIVSGDSLIYSLHLELRL